MLAGYVGCLGGMGFMRPGRLRAAMRRVDLHAHTTASDGTLSPTELVEVAAKEGLAAVAVTDHDSLLGVAEARAAGVRLGVEVVPGVELSCRWPDGQLHLLGYFMEPGADPLESVLGELRRERETRGVRMAARLRDLGVDVTAEDVRREAGEGAVGRPHVARALMTRGHVASVQEAFDRYLADGRPAAVPKRAHGPEEAVRLVRESGGVPVLAHAGTVGAGSREELIRRLARAGLEGLEVDHSSHGPGLRRRLGELAAELRLVATGGSDFHGANKPHVRLGSGVDGNVRVEYGTLEELRARRP